MEQKQDAVLSIQGSAGPPLTSSETRPTQDVRRLESPEKHLTQKTVNRNNKMRGHGLRHGSALLQCRLPGVTGLVDERAR